MKLDIEKYKTAWNETLEKLKLSVYAEWFKGYFYTSVLTAFIVVSYLLLLLLFMGKLTPLVISVNTGIGIFLTKIVVFIISTAISIVTYSAVNALVTITFVRYIPSFLTIYLLINQGFIGFNATISSANLLQKYNEAMTVTTPFLIIMFIFFYMMAIIFTYRVITIVLNKIDARLNRDSPACR